MSFIQQRSFIATLSSITPGYEGILDSFERKTVPASRCNHWLTLSSLGEGSSQQRFWFGYHDGKDAGYRVMTVESEDGTSHQDIWDLGIGNCVGYYPKVDTPLSWRIWVSGKKLGTPEVTDYSNVTIAAVGSVPLGIRDRKPWEDKWVSAGGPIKLIMRLSISEVNVPNFENYAQFRRR